MAQSEIFVNVTGWAGPWAQWQFSINKAAQIAHGIRMDSMLWRYGNTAKGMYYNKSLLQRAAMDAKARGLKMRVILAYNLAWGQHFGDGMGARPYETSYNDYAAVMNDVIATVNAAYGPGFRAMVSYEFWNEPSRRTNDGSQAWDAKFLDFARNVVPKLNMNGTTLWAPTIHGHPENVAFEIDWHNQQALMYPSLYSKFGGWAFNVYNSRPIKTSLDVNHHVNATVINLQAVWNKMQTATNLLAISTRIIISETGVGANQMAPVVAGTHDVRIAAIDAIVRKAALMGFESVGVYRLDDGNIAEVNGHYYGLYKNDQTPYSTKSNSINWKFIA